MGGPLSGLRVVEFEARGPGPFGVMLLADLGAAVTRIARAKPDVAPANDFERMVRGERRIDLLSRGRSGTIDLDLKNAADLGAALELIDTADVLVEGFRPGVTER